MISACSAGCADWCESDYESLEERCAQPNCNSCAGCGEDSVTGSEGSAISCPATHPYMSASASDCTHFSCPWGWKGPCCDKNPDRLCDAYCGDDCNDGSTPIGPRAFFFLACRPGARKIGQALIRQSRFPQVKKKCKGLSHSQNQQHSFVLHQKMNSVAALPSPLLFLSLLLES